jgi:hypothetical protein
MAAVECGKDGKGYKVNLPTKFLKTAIPILKWGIFFLQIVAASQGLGAVIPSVSGLLGSLVSNSDIASLVSLIDSAISSTIKDSVSPSIDAATLSLDKAQDNDEVIRPFISEQGTCNLDSQTLGHDVMILPDNLSCLIDGLLAKSESIDDVDSYQESYITLYNFLCETNEEKIDQCNDDLKHTGLKKVMDGQTRHSYWVTPVVENDVKQFGFESSKRKFADKIVRIEQINKYKADKEERERLKASKDKLIEMKKRPPVRHHPIPQTLPFGKKM